jgi:hypothetical protein
MPQHHQRVNQQLVKFLAPKLRYEFGFRVPIFFQVFLIIRFFRFPAGFIPSNRRQYKLAKQTTLKHLLRQHLYEAGCSGHYQMHKWGVNSQPLHHHQFLENMFNLGYFKPRIFKLLYSTAQNGFSNSKFHELCDKKGPTMTVYTLNGKTVLAILQRSWNVLDYGWQYDPDLKIFFVDHDGTTVELKCTHSKEEVKYYNGCLSGPHFGGLPIDFRSKRTEVHFWQRELITGGPKNYYANINSVVVLEMSICLETVSPLILARVARLIAPYCRIGGGEVRFPYYPPRLL